jgi:hypothetical protein
VAVDAKFKIYVSDSTNSAVTTYKRNGTQIGPTITAGLDHPRAIALH